MDFLRKLFKKEPAVAASSTSEPSLSTAEDIIATLRQSPVAEPICWLVCYEDRPLQGAPPSGSEPLKPYLLIFTSTTQAEGWFNYRLK